MSSSPHDTLVLFTGERAVEPVAGRGDSAALRARL
jgi:hypothetical protein